MKKLLLGAVALFAGAFTKSEAEAFARALNHRALNQ